MMWNEQTQQDARRFVESLTQKQWNALLYCYDVLNRQPTEEEKAKERERLEKIQKEKEAKTADFEQKQAAFREMKKKINKKLSIPERYEWSYDELHPLFLYATHPLADNEAIYNVADAMFELGFKRGMSYQQSREAKKANEAMKKACHPSQIKALKQALNDM